jgi:hydrogenase maturation protease
VGVRVVDELRARTLPDDVEVVDGGTQGLGIVPLLQGRRRIIFVDAADMGREPGDFCRFTPNEARLGGAGLMDQDRRIAIHEAGLRDALLLAELLGVVPEEVIIFGVQPANLDWDSVLSPQVAAALPSLIDAVLAELPDTAE